MNRWLIAGVMLSASCSTWAAASAEHADRLARVYEETAHLPEFTRQMARMRALGEHSAVDLSSAGTASPEFDSRFPMVPHATQAMHPQDVERLRRELEQRPR